MFSGDGAAQWAKTLRKLSTALLLPCAAVRDLTYVVAAKLAIHLELVRHIR